MVNVELIPGSVEPSVIVPLRLKVIVSPEAAWVIACRKVQLLAFGHGVPVVSASEVTSQVVEAWAGRARNKPISAALSSMVVRGLRKIENLKKDGMA
jgi:hypothetical protein